MKKVYIPLGAVLAVVAFFVFYNNYLVDRSLVNLQKALILASEAKSVEDFEKIRPLLRIPLFIEVSKTVISGKSLAALGMIENIINTAKSSEQAEDIKLYLKTMIGEKEKQRGWLLSGLDRLNQNIYQPIVDTDRNRLLAKARGLSSKISSANDPVIRQSLYYDLGNVYAELGDLDSAESSYLKCSQINSQNPLGIKAIFNLAWLCKDLRQFEKAFAYFNMVVDLYRESPLSLDTRFQVADLWFKKGEYRKSAVEFGSLAEDNPEFSLADIALYQAGYISFYNLNDKSNAITYFNKLEEQHPKAPAVQNVMVYVRPAVAKDYRIIGFRMLREGRYEEAVDNFIRAVTVAPLDYRSYSGMALGLLWLNKNEEAIEKARKAQDYSSKDDMTLVNAMYVFIEDKKFDEAIIIGTKALDYRRNRIPEFYFNLGNAYYKNKEYFNAVVEYDKAIKHNPEFTIFHNNLACALWATKNYSRSINELKYAIDLDPGYMDAHFNLGLNYFLLNRFEEAYREFKIVADGNPNDKQARSYMRRIALSLKYQPD